MLLVLLLIIVLPLKNQAFWTGSGGEFTASKYLGAICFIYAVFYLFARRRIPSCYLATKQARWYGVFFLLIVGSYVRVTATSSAGYNPILGPTSLLLLGFVLLSVVDSLKRLRLVLLAAMASIGFASLYVIREWEKGRGWETGSRGEWVVGDSNHFAVSAICGLTIAWYMAQERGPVWQKWLCRLCLTLALIAIVIGASRGGLLGLVAAMLFVAIRSQKRTRNIVAVVAVIVGFNIAYPHSPLRRLLHPDVSARASETAHLASWEAGVAMVRTHPLAGVGIAAFRSEMLKYAPAWYVVNKPFMAHNAYISVAAEIGLPGLAVFLTILVTTYLSLERMHRKKRAPRLITRAALALQAALLGDSIAIFFISAEHHEYLWLMIFMSMCLPPFATRVRGRRVGTVPTGEQDVSPAAVLSRV